MPYRIAAPPEPPEPEHPYAQVIRRARVRGRLLALGAGAAVLALVVTALARPARPRPDPRVAEADRADRAVRAGEAIASARARAAREQSRFEERVRDAIRREVAPASELGACPFTLPKPTGLARPFPMLFVERSQLASLPSRAIADVLADVQRAEAHLASGRYEEAALYAAALDRPDRFPRDVVFVATEWKKPRATSDALYEPGEVAGRALLYDFETGEVVCAADVRAKSSPQIGFAYAVTADAPVALGRHARLEASIEEDLQTQLERAVADAMRFRAR